MALQGFRVTGAFELAAKLGAAAPALEAAQKAVVRTMAQQGLAMVRANASGRPGPRRVTGDYVRSMNVRSINGGWGAEIGTNAPQARRLEYGFHGTDSLSRTYAQGPLPHWRPMREKLKPMFEEAMRVSTIGALTTAGLL